MKSRSILVPLILAAASAIGATAVAHADAQSQAAALLGGSHSSAVTIGEAPVRSVHRDRVFEDPHASAAALLSGSRFSQSGIPSVTGSSRNPEVPTDPHERAAALLSGVSTGAHTR
jgi:hypothetical protein